MQLSTAAPLVLARRRACRWAINAEGQGFQGFEGRRPPPKAPERTRAIPGGLREREMREGPFRPLVQEDTRLELEVFLFSKTTSPLRFPSELPAQVKGTGCGSCASL